MAAKEQAAHCCRAAGIDVVIAAGVKPDVISKVIVMNLSEHSFLSFKSPLERVNDDFCAQSRGYHCC